MIPVSLNLAHKLKGVQSSIDFGYGGAGRVLGGRKFPW